MAPLRILYCGLALIAAVPAQADEVSRWKVYIGEASARFGIPSSWIEEVMRAESAGMTELGGRAITSPAGAMGLMQLMPATWSDMRTVLGLGTDPHDPRDNILAGTYYLKLMHDRFGYPGLFAAYNAGPGRYGAALAGKARLPAETRAYLRRLSRSTGPRTARIGEPQSSSLFFALRGTSDSQTHANDAGSSGVFVLGTDEGAVGSR